MNMQPVKTINIEEMKHMGREVMIQDLFNQVKNVVIYLNTNIIEITDMSKETPASAEHPQPESAKKSILSGLFG
jgi:hypothetical protein